MSPQSRRERCEHRTEWPLAAVAVLFLALYSVQVLVAPQGRVADVLNAALVALYVLFVTTRSGLYLADPRGRAARGDTATGAICECRRWGVPEKRVEGIG